MKKSLSIFLFFFFGLSFYQCFDCNCGPALPYFDITGFSVNGRSKTGNYVYERVNYDDFDGIAINFAASYLGNLQNKKTKIFAPNSLLACDCVSSGFEGSKTEKFKELNIITVNDFDVDHPVRANINEFFQIKDKSGVWQDLNTYIKTDTSLIFSQYIDLRLLKLPPKSLPFQVEVQLKVDDNEAYSAMSREITFY